MQDAFALRRGYRILTGWKMLSSDFCPRLANRQFFSFGYGLGKRGEGHSPNLNKGVIQIFGILDVRFR